MTLPEDKGGKNIWSRGTRIFILEQFTVLRSFVSTVEEGILNVFGSNAEQGLLGRLNDLAPSSRAKSSDQLLDFREQILDRIQVG